MGSVRMSDGPRLKIEGNVIHAILVERKYLREVGTKSPGRRQARCQKE